MRTANAFRDEGERFVTSDAVLVEVLTYVSGLGEFHRRRATDLVRATRLDAEVEVVAQTRDLFDRGLDLYERRGDKAYSLTDCMSMQICHQRDIKRVLTHDHHFAQEGFEILL